MKWIGQQIYDQISRFRNNVFIDNSDLTIYKPINNDPAVINLGSSATERLEIKANYASGTQEVNNATFKTYTGSATSNRGRFIFSADETTILQIWDAGLNLTASKALQIDGTDIITDSSGTATLSNIDALDATTEATIEAAMDTLSNVTSLGTLTGLTVGGDTNFTSGSSARPSVSIANTGNNTEGGTFSFQLDKGAAGADNDVPGLIFWQSDNDAQEQCKFAEIYGTVADATDGQEAGAMYLKVAAYDGVLETGLKLDGDTDADGEVDVTVGSGAASVATIAGTLTMGTTAFANNSGVIQVATQGTIDHDSLANFVANEHIDWAGSSAGTIHSTNIPTLNQNTTGSSASCTGQAATVATIAGLAPNTATTQATQAAITTCANLTTVGTIGTGVWQGTAIAQAYIAGDAINGDKIADDAVDSEHYTDGSIDTAHIGDDQVTFAKASGVTPNVYGSIIKLLPSDFAANDDGGNTKFGVGYVDHAGATTYGMRAANAGTELYAFVSIPEGMKATHVDIYDRNSVGVIVYEVQINGTTMVSKGTGNANSTIDITDVNSTATNFLAIQVTTVHATNSLIHGGSVTIAAI